MSTPMQYDLHETGGVLYLCLEGDLDQRSFLAVSNALAGHRLGLPVKVDLSRVGYADSTGLRSLVLLQRQARDAGSDFTLLQPSDAVKRIFKSTGLYQVFKVDEGEDSDNPCSGRLDREGE